MVEIVVGVDPSKYVILHGPVPVRAILISGIGNPEHITPPPAIIAVGSGFVKIVADPDIVEGHPEASVNEAMV